MKRKKLSKKTKMKISNSHKTSRLAIQARKILHQSQIGRKRDKKTREIMAKNQFKKGQIPWNKGIPVNKETRIRLQKAMKGKKHSFKTILKMRRAHKGKQYTLGFHPSIDTRKKLSKAHKGKKHYNWKGGITKKSALIRRSLEIRIWRESIFRRDNYTCQKYKKRGGVIHAHHIQNFAQYPNLRFNIDNGITLSRKAHKEFHDKYGRKNNTKKQLMEFLTI